MTKWQDSAAEGISGGTDRLQYKKGFVHLHVHSEHSPHDGTVPVKDYVTRVRNMGMGALALTDHGVMPGVEELFQECQKAGIRPIAGSEVYVEPFSGVSGRSRHHLVLLAENRRGYYNLKHLIAEGHFAGNDEYSLITRKMLEENSTGLIALSACRRGEVPSLVLEDRYNEALEVAGSYLEIFEKDSYFLELVGTTSKPYPELNKRLIKLAGKTGLPLVATGDVHYLEKGEFMHPPGSPAFPPNRRIPEQYKIPLDDFYLKSAGEMWEIFRSDAPHAVRNAVSIAERCNY